MRALALLLAAAVVACSPPSETAQTGDSSEWDMGPMPPVAALYDYGVAPPATLDELSYYMTRDLAEALSAEGSPVDFDWRSWAEDPEIENQTFGLSEHPPEDRAVVSTRFTYPGIGGGMIVEYTLCRRGPSDWKIEDVRGQPTDGSEATPGLRQMLGLPAQSPTCA